MMSLTNPAEYDGYFMAVISTSPLPPYRREWLGACWLLTLPGRQALQAWNDLRYKHPAEKE